MGAAVAVAAQDVPMTKRLVLVLKKNTAAAFVFHSSCTSGGNAQLRHSFPGESD